jgi:hypothetical protein
VDDDGRDGGSGTGRETLEQSIEEGSHTLPVSPDGPVNTVCDSFALERSGQQPSGELAGWRGEGSRGGHGFDETD